MHDLDRTQLETEQFGEYEYEAGSDGEARFGGSVLDELIGGGELEQGEERELELASALLEVSDEQEFEQFLGDIARSVGQAAGRFVRSDTGKALTGILRDAAKKALPVVGGAVGGWIAPGRGEKVGSALATAAGDVFGLELEGLSPADREFEVAKQFVRFAEESFRKAAAAPQGAPAHAVARAAAEAAAKQFAPGLLPALAGAGAGSTGRWIRRGNTIVLFGA